MRVGDLDVGRRVRPLALVLLAGVVTAVVACSPTPTLPSAPNSRCAFPAAATQVSTALVGADSSNPLLVTATLNGIQKWNAAGHRGPTFVAAGQPLLLQFQAFNDPNNSIVGALTNGQLSQGPACGATGWSGTPRIYINVGALFVSRDPFGVAVQVGSHEVGHALGLAHTTQNQPPLTTCPGSVMWWSTDVFYKCGVNGPTTLDVQGVNGLYE